MGKQINYWLGYKDFLKVAQVALDSNCVILKYENDVIKFGNTLDIIIENSHDRYYFLPLDLNIEPNEKLNLMELRSNCQVIEAGYSYMNHDKKIIVRNRLYIGTGFYDEAGVYIYRSEIITKIYNKLMRTVKKVAPYTELTDTYICSNDVDYLQEKVYTHKEYVTSECLELREMQGYKLKAFNR